MKFRSISTYQKHEGERFTLPSLTRPDESLSIKELYLRYAQGRPLDNIRRTGYYDDELNDDNPYYDSLEDGDTDLVDYQTAMIEEAERAVRIEAAALRKAKAKAKLAEPEPKPLEANAASPVPPAPPVQPIAQG